MVNLVTDNFVTITITDCFIIIRKICYDKYGNRLFYNYLQKSVMLNTVIDYSLIIRIIIAKTVIKNTVTDY